MQDRGRVARVEQPRRIPRVVAAERGEAGGDDRRGGPLGVERVALGQHAVVLVVTDGGHQPVVGQREHLRQPPLLVARDLDAPAEPAEQPRAPQAVLAGVAAAAHAASSCRASS